MEGKINMVKRIRLLLDYGCYPVWLYDENNDIIDTLLPEELRSDVELDKKFDDLQARYEALFINKTHEFSYVGFQTKGERKAFWRDWDAASAELRKKICGKYPVFDEGVIDHCPVIGQKDLFAIKYTFSDENRTTELSMYVISGDCRRMVRTEPAFEAHRGCPVRKLKGMVEMQDLRK